MDTINIQRHCANMFKDWHTSHSCKHIKTVSHSPTSHTDLTMVIKPIFHISLTGPGNVSFLKICT